MAALKVNPDNSITLPIPLLAIMLTAFLAVCGWGASIRNDVEDLKSWRVEHIKQEDLINGQQNAALAEVKNMVLASSAENTKQNATIYETMTNIRIQLAAHR